MPEPVRTMPAQGYSLLSLRLSEDEARRVAQAARAAGRSVPQHTRHQLICAPTETRWQQALPFALWRQLERLGVNLNQLRKLDAAPGLQAQILRLHQRVSDRLNADLALDRRPALPVDNRRRGIVRAVRVSADQRTVIEALAAQADLRLSDYARAALIEGRVVVRKVREMSEAPDPEAFREQGQILNRLTHAANAEGVVSERAGPVLEAIDGLMDRVPEVTPP